MTSATTRLLLTFGLIAFAAPVPLYAADAPTTAPATKPAAVRKLDVEAFDKARQADGAIVLDVRSPEEFAAGHVPGAINVPVTGAGSEAFEKTVAALPKDKPVLVHCRSGPRATKACGAMTGMGFADLSIFPGGWVAWSGAGKPVEKGAGK